MATIGVSSNKFEPTPIAGMGLPWTAEPPTYIRYTNTQVVQVTVLRGTVPQRHIFKISVLIIPLVIMPAVAGTAERWT